MTELLRIRHCRKSVFTVQFHPEAAPGPHDAYPLFARFREMVDTHYGVETDASP